MKRAAAMHPFIFCFESDAFDRSFPTDGSDPNHPPKGQDLAEYLKTAFTQRQLPVSGPFEGEGGWHLYLRLGKQEFDLSVYLLPLGSASDESWVLHPRKTPGLWRALFGRPVPGLGTEPLCNIITEILTADSRIQALQVLDEHTFDQLF